MEINQTDISQTDINGIFNPYKLSWDSTIIFPSTRKLEQLGNRIYNRYPARSVFLVPRATILHKLKERPISVLDPFMGSGTTAVEATNLNCVVYGAEMDPFARLIAEVSSIRFSKVEKEELNEKFEQIIRNWQQQIPIKKYYPDLKNIEYWFDDNVFNDLLKLKSYIYENVANEKYLNFLKVAFADCIKPSSKMERQSTKPYISSKYEKKKKPVGESFEYSYNAHFNAISQCNDNVESETRINWVGFDATDFNSIDQIIDLAITSPPYLNAFDYTQIIKIESAWVGTLVNSDIDKLRKLQVGHAKRREQEIFEVVSKIFSQFYDQLLFSCPKTKKTSNLNVANNSLAYFNDIFKNLLSVYRALKDDGEYHMIIGDNVINSVSIPTHKIIAELAQEVGFKWDGYYKYPIKDHRTSIPRNNNGGKIDYEYVLILTK
ncbi:DNA methyltransferase [Labilibaculum sp.]|uniref:DNA methyltransferase n=1 Tax=Labilibaculum sp. TaxID=2060723 RepID=UPI003565EC4F